MIGDELIRDVGTRYALTTIATGGEGVADDEKYVAQYQTYHISMGDDCTMSEFCLCGPRLICESALTGSEVWEHWAEWDGMV